MHDKSELRAILAARRAAAFGAEPDAGERLAAHFPFLVFKHVIVAGYMPFRTEIDPLPLLRLFARQGAQSVFPRMDSPSSLRGRGEVLMFHDFDPAIPSTFAQANSPSHLWGGVGVGGGAADTHTVPLTTTAPHPPAPSPQGGRGGVFDRDRARRLRSAPTKAEQKLWDLLRVKRPEGSHWRRQMTIGGYVYDFGCHRLKLLVEVDGGVHRLPEVQARDQVKEQVAVAHGYHLIRLQNEDVLKIETVQYFDQFAQTNSPSPLWGRVGMGGTAADTTTTPVTNTAPHPPATSPQGGEALTFHVCDIDNHGHFQKNKWGLLEPIVDLPTATPTILVVPLLGFDRQGNRLGYGKGYYDATIQALKSQGPLTTIGLAFAQQEVAHIPTQSHDERLDWIITQNEAYAVPS